MQVRPQTPWHCDCLADTDIIKRFDLHSDVDNIQGFTIVGNNLAVADNTNDRIWYDPLSCQ